MKQITEKDIIMFVDQIFENKEFSIRDYEPFITALSCNIKDIIFKRMETQGDSLLGTIATNLIIEDNIKNTHKDIFYLKSFFVSDETNKIYCRILKIDEKFPKKKYDRLFEAFLAAIYINIGFDNTLKWFRTTLFEKVKDVFNTRYENKKIVIQKIKKKNKNMNYLLVVRGSRVEAAEIYENLVNFLAKRTNISPLKINSKNDENLWKTVVSIEELEGIQGIGRSNMKQESISLAIIKFLENIIERLRSE